MPEKNCDPHGSIPHSSGVGESCALPGAGCPEHPHGTEPAPRQLPGGAAALPFLSRLARDSRGVLSER